MTFLHPKIFGALEALDSVSSWPLYLTGDMLRLCLLTLKLLDSANVQLNQVASKNNHYCSSLLLSVAVIKH